MRVVLRNSDIVSSYKSALLGSVITKSVFKNKFFNLVDNYSEGTRSGSGYLPLPIDIYFNTPINDGRLDSAKPVADFFFPTYEFGLAHWPNELDHLWPGVLLYPLSRAERIKNEQFLVSSSDPAFLGFFQRAVFEDVNSVDYVDAMGIYYPEKDPTELVVNTYNVDTLEGINITAEGISYVSVYDDPMSENAVLLYYTITETKRVFYFYDLQKMRKNMSSTAFAEWLDTEGRIVQDIETEDGGWFSDFFSFALSALAIYFTGPMGFIISTAINMGTTMFSKDKDKMNPSESSYKNDMLWSVDDDEYLGDDIMAVPPLPHY
ncbi:MAG: hypothetical protein PHX44_01330 [Sulfurimonas sp.]|uniref:hypothetical protein n=1 Tax=Sulfurimonas sp. TaxID=2022749 RepID=UPI00260E2951|nr:hypothetical protein [Sulfurimonas sp.]MDD2651675.1 hypothetical protein [Sulfurimonas sp.]MDD3451486.1 hypothetical protein [Sulfurimonas sp.]